MSTVVHDVRQVTPRWLTSLLQSKGYLHDGQVHAVQTVRSQETNISAVYHLLVHYTI